MSYVAIARVRTEHAARYLQQVCKHWSHNLDVTYDEQQGRIVFPRDARGADWPADAVVTLTAAPDTLECRVEASAPGQRDGLKGALERHIDRFAFREAPIGYEWRAQARIGSTSIIAARLTRSAWARAATR
ncbi:MAG TPA: DUF2218 domain-containing protein [Allosphingosinicella sp.]|jgi:hypothetical protein